MSNHPSLDAYDDLFKLEEGEELSLYTARDRSRDKKVALWVWKRKREQGESEEAVDLNHPLLSPVLRTGVDSGESFLAQELPEGRPLATLLKEENPPVHKILHIVAQVASIVTEIHRNGNVHGNLSPWSIFVSDDGKVHLLGAGMAHLFGDPAYISPEKARKQTLTPSSDIFSLGTILYESLTGFAPFPGETRLEVQRAVAHNPTPRMQIGRTDLPREVVRLTETCLAKDPDARYKDADVFLEALMSLAFETPQGLDVTRPRLRRFAAVGFLLSGLFLVTLYFLGGPRVTSSVDDEGPYSHWRRVAVMKPEYVGEHATRPFLAQGVEDEIVSALTTNTTLDVISTLSTRVYRDSEKSAQRIAEELMADGLIESTLVDDGNRMNLHIRLSDGQTGKYLWDHRLEITRETIVEIQDRLEAILYSEFRPVWVRTGEHLQRASTVEAYTLFLEGKQLLSRYTAEDNRKAIDKFQLALSKDQLFAPAWAAVARAYGNVVNVEESRDSKWLDKADEAAVTAIRLAPKLPDGYYARGTVSYFRHLYFGAADWFSALRDFDGALRLSPDFPDALLAKAFILLWQGVESEDTELARESIELFQRALALRPNLPNAEANYAYALVHIGKTELATERLDKAISNHPDSSRLHIALGNVLLFRGDAERAIRVTEEAFGQGVLESSLHQARLAAFHAAAGDAETVSEILGDVHGPFVSNEDFYMASALAGIGLEEKALARLRDWNERMGSRHEQLRLFRWWLRKDPNFRALRESGALEPFLG